ncbi:MAG: DUF2203 domain-containing protein [Acidimicrobiales bacterium]
MPDADWTLDRARAYLPRLQELLRTVRGALDMQARVKTNGHGSRTDPAAESAIAEIEERGIIVRDLDRGLVDFPSRQPGGTVVLLCWQAGEPDIEWWHLPEEGFAGRKRLPLPPTL